MNAPLLTSDATAAAYSVVTAISNLIILAMKGEAYHSWNPSQSADNDDAKMKAYAERIKELRQMRDKFEDLMFRRIHD